MLVNRIGRVARQNEERLPGVNAKGEVSTGDPAEEIMRIAELERKLNRMEKQINRRAQDTGDRLLPEDP